ncbi:DUF3363 domain-containing protein, partial [Escherichia coli]|uniref:DUF3363 domain-containing protein n=1 Tax=Escherichia coli TaxID=562 RepID=UPI003CC7D7E0
MAQAAKDIAADTGLEHRPVADGQRVAGVYRRPVMLASGRNGMLDDAKGSSLVRWKPIEPRQPGGCKLKTAPVRPVVAARPAE